MSALLAAGTQFQHNLNTYFQLFFRESERRNPFVREHVTPAALRLCKARDAVFALALEPSYADEAARLAPFRLRLDVQVAEHCYKSILVAFEEIPRASDSASFNARVLDFVRALDCELYRSAMLLDYAARFPQTLLAVERVLITLCVFLLPGREIYGVATAERIPKAAVETADAERVARHLEGEPAQGLMHAVLGYALEYVRAHAAHYDMLARLYDNMRHLQIVCLPGQQMSRSANYETKEGGRLPFTYAFHNEAAAVAARFSVDDHVRLAAPRSQLADILFAVPFCAGCGSEALGGGAARPAAAE